MLTLEQLISEATVLTDSDKVILIDKIVESMTGQLDQDLLIAGVKQAQARIAEIDSGAVQNHSWRYCPGSNSTTARAMKYEFHPAALQEYAEAVQFFAQENRHQDFINTIEKSIFRIVSAPERWPIIEEPIRRYLTPKFSYAILYRVYSDRIVIAAIMSCRRDPGYWQDRLKKS